MFDLSSSDMQDAMSSWWCGKSVSYDFCNNTASSCTQGNGMTGAGHARSPNAGHNDSVSRVNMRYYDASAQGAVTTFYDSECRSDAGRF